MQPRTLSISLAALYEQHTDAPSDLSPFDYKGNTIAVSFNTGIVYRVDKKVTTYTKWNRIKEGTDIAPHTNYSLIWINRATEQLHRVVKACEIGRYLVDTVDLVDHRDGIGTHNWASNLRLHANEVSSNESGNARNRRNQGVSQAYGVDWQKHRLKFRARATLSGAEVHLGMYVNESAAAFASDIFTYYLYGGHARLNDPRCIPFYRTICVGFTDKLDLKAFIIKNRLYIDRLFDGVDISREKFVELQARNDHRVDTNK